MEAECVWEEVVVGGGPAAALQAVHAGGRPGAMLVVSDELGGSLAMLGRQRTQSYADELDLGAPGLSVRDHVEAGAGAPTGAAYVGYVRRALEGSGATIAGARVHDVRPDGDALVVMGSAAGRPVCWRARKVVLATGSTPRPLPAGLGAAGVRSCVDVYGDVEADRTERYRGRTLVVVGCGNTALQLAALLAWVAREVIVLANRYVGLYPQETIDRFAWRSMSQQTCELVVRSRQRAESSPPAPHPSVRYLVYDALEVDGPDLVFSYSRCRNGNVLGRHSLPAPTGAPVPPEAGGEGPDRWRERLPLRGTEVVSAIGFAPAYPPGPAVASLPRDGAGVVRHDANGATDMRGLFVAGACAGFPAVNFMRAAGQLAPSR